MTWVAPTLRALTPVDAVAALATIHAAFAAQSVQTDPPSAALRETVCSIAAEITAGGGACVPDGAGFAAVMLWREKDGGLYLGRLAVRPEWRRRGLARALIAAAETEARRRSLPRLHLGTRLVLADNRALFVACGFTEAGFTTHPGYAAPTSVVMEKCLTTAGGECKPR
jgi:GNAT superfamily N-acetyltransferase